MAFFKKPSLESLKKEIESLNNLIGGNASLIPAFGSEETYKPRVNIIGKDFVYAWPLNSPDPKVLTTKDKDTLLYWVFSHISYQYAQAAIFEIRSADKDPRRLIYAKQLELLGRLSPKWVVAERAKIEKELIQTPFSDENAATMPRELKELKLKIDELALEIGAREDDLPTFGISDGTGRPHLEFKDHLYHFVSSERGIETDRKSTEDIEEILYIIFEYVTYQLNCRVTIVPQDPKLDQRRALFQAHVELMRKLSPSWGVRTENSYKEVLRHYPFQDS